MTEILLTIHGHEFQIKKEILCEYSDYFRAMFSGNYVENNQNKITIDVLDPEIMEILMRYMKIGLIDLFEYPLSIIGGIASAANYLQMTELIKQVEYSLDLQISNSNWLQIMAIAENSSFSKLQQLSAAFGLFSFSSMKPEYIPNLHNLVWYLSHSYLDALCELDVFNFGFEWISQHETGADALLIILGCLDVKRLKINDLIAIKKILRNFENSLAARVVELFDDLIQNNVEMSLSVLDKRKSELCEKYTERVWTEVYNIVKQSNPRKLMYTPVMATCTHNSNSMPHCLYTFKEQEGYENYIHVAENKLWGWNIISWGLTKIVFVCGEHGRGTGNFMRDVRVYDTLRKEWTNHGVTLPQRRHAGLAVVGDTLFFVGGVGGYRVILETAGIYDLKQRSYRAIAKFPDAIQNPALCTHKNNVYAAGYKSIYTYKEMADADYWKQVLATEIKLSCMSSHKDYIYCIQSYFSHLYRFRPNVDDMLETITHFSSLPAVICNLGPRLVAFTKTICDDSYTLTLEEFNEDNGQTKVVYQKADLSMIVNEVPGLCVQVLSIPPLNLETSQYLKRYLSWYPNKQL